MVDLTPSFNPELKATVIVALPCASGCGLNDSRPTYNEIVY